MLILSESSWNGNKERILFLNHIFSNPDRPARILESSLTSISLFDPAFFLDDLRAVLDDLVHRRGGLVLGVVVAGHAGESHDVGRSDLDHRQFGELDVLLLGGDGGLQGVECRRDGVNPLSLPGVGLHPPLPGHVLVVPLLGLVSLPP